MDRDQSTEALNNVDMRNMAEIVASAVKEYVALAVADLSGRLAKVEKAPPPVEASVIKALIDAEVQDHVRAAVGALPPPTDLTPLTDKVAHIEETFEVRLGALREATRLQIGAAPEELKTLVEVDHRNLENLHDRVMKLEGEREGLAGLEESVLRQAKTALAEGQADTIGRLEARIDGLATAVAKRIDQLPPPDLSSLEVKFGLLQQLVLDNHDELHAQITKVELGHDALIATVDDRFKTFVGPFNDRIAALEARPPPPPGEPGAPGRDGERGEKGADGLAGKDGERGSDGRDGRDALALEILDGVDETRRYQRGTVATFRGGLIRAFRATDPLGAGVGLERAGWHVLMNGIAEMASELQNEREFVQRTVFTNGAVNEVRTRLATPLYQGIWKKGVDYHTGDSVTYGGSSFIAQRDTTDEAPETNDAWRLAVKRGRDGKNGKDGKPGDPGPKGDRGRDLTQIDFSTGRRF